MKKESKANNSLDATNKISWLTTQRTMLAVTVACIIAFVTLSSFENIAGSTALKNAVLGLVSALLGAGVVGLLWEYGSKKSFTLEMQQSFSSMMDTLARRASIASIVENDGLIGVTSDFHYGIPWREYIRDSNDIDVCWWAGETWLTQNMSAINEQISSTDLTIRYLIPDTGDRVILEQMMKDSGLPESKLSVATYEARTTLDSFGDNATLVLMKRVPRFAMIRIGWRVIFFPYALSPGKNQDRPTFVLDARKPLGKLFCEDFESMWRLAKTDPIS